MTSKQLRLLIVLIVVLASFLWTAGQLLDFLRPILPAWGAAADSGLQCLLWGGR